MSFTFAQIFLASLAFFVLLHTVVCIAEIRHLKHHSKSVPEEFQSHLSFALHKKNIVYDLARTRLNCLEAWVTSAVVLFLTVGGIINHISDFLLEHIGDGFAFHWMLPSIVAFILILSDLPFYWFKAFRLRESYGYLRISPIQWLLRYLSLTFLGFIAVLPVLWILLFLWRHTGTAWWIIGWVIFCFYSLFSLNLATRLSYWLFHRKSIGTISKETLQLLEQFSQDTQTHICSTSVCRPEDNDKLPPVFAFGTRNNIALFIRHDVHKNFTGPHLRYLVAHAIARNRSHMYLQSWFVTILLGLGVFLFLKWLAPQSWFMDELGFRVYGPGPYYGPLLSFVLVALPMFIFPLKLLLDWFLRHQIIKSDQFAVRQTDSKTMKEALVRLLPRPLRHSVCTLGLFDLLFSHEPSITLRLSLARAYEKKRQVCQSVPSKQEKDS